MAVTPETVDSDVVTNINLEKFAFWTWNQASFFHENRTIGHTLWNLILQKWVSRDFSKNNLS
jgi:hypothetical protein